MNRHKEIKIAVLMGGVSSEREVSLSSGAAVAGALRETGFDASELVLDEESLTALDGRETDVAFVALHGGFGEDGRIQRMLDEAGIPYTGSPPPACRIAMAKNLAKERFAEAGLLTPPFAIFEREPEGAPLDAIFERLGATVVVKPLSEGSSIGISIVERDGFSVAFGEAHRYGGGVVVERFIDGRELTVGVLGEVVLPVIEMEPGGEFFDFNSKYEKGWTNYIVNPELPPGAGKRAKAAGLDAFRILGCRDFGRTDMILARDGEIYILEVNTIPGFTATSLVPKAARAAGIEFTGLCEQIVKMALKRAGVGV